MSRRMLSKAESFSLMTAVQQTYVDSKLTDGAYAEKFSADSGIPVTEGNVAGARKALGLESNWTRGTQAAQTAATEVLEKLSTIEDKLGRLLKYFSEQARRDL